MKADGGTVRGPGFAVGITLLGVAAVVGELVALLPPGPNDWAAYAASWVLLGAVAVMVFRFGRRTDGWAVTFVPIGYLAAATLLIQSEATARTGLNLLLLLPVLWSSLYLRPWNTAVTVLCAVVLEARLVIAAGGVSGYVIIRSLVLWTLLAVFIAVSTHWLRDRLERSTARSLEAARAAEGLRRAAESLIGLRRVADVEAVATELASSLGSPPGVVRRATFYEIGGNMAMCAAEHDEIGELMGLTWEIWENPLVDKALRQGHGIALALEGLTFSPDLQAVVDANGITHGAAIPVFADRLVFGVLTVASRGAEISPELVDVLDGLVHIVELALTNALASERAERLATTDPMTNLLNRRGLEGVVEARRAGRPFTVLAFDLDGLKTLNDEYGHQAGDDLLCRFAEVARSQMRRTDALARVGGDEFLAVLFDSTQFDAEALAFRVLNAASEVSVAGRPIRLSIGIATGQRGSPFDEVVQQADDRLYAAKRDGGGKFFASADEFG